MLFRKIKMPVSLRNFLSQGQSFIGFTGSIGYTGSAGPQGEQGPAGGYTGSQGAVGYTGSTGEVTKIQATALSIALGG